MVGGTCVVRVQCGEAEHFPILETASPGGAVAVWTAGTSTEQQQRTSTQIPNASLQSHTARLLIGMAL